MLKELEQRLREAGVGKEALLNMTVKLKDAEIGAGPFAEAWNAWLGGISPPAISMFEAFWGEQGKLVAVSAVAAV